MNKVGFWTPVVGSGLSHFAQACEWLFNLGNKVAVIQPCECHTGSVKGVKLEATPIPLGWRAIRIGFFAGSILLSLHKMASSKPLSHIRHLPAAALTFLFLAKVYHRRGTQYEVCDTSAQYETPTFNTCTLFDVIQGENLDSHVINFVVENIGNAKLEQPKNYFSIQPKDMNICWLGALQDHYRQDMRKEGHAINAVATAYAVIQLTIIEMSKLKKPDDAYWGIIRDSLCVYCETFLDQRDTMYKMNNSSYTLRQLYNMLIDALEPLDKPQGWDMTRDDAVVKKSSSQPANIGPVTIDSLIQLAKSTGGIRFQASNEVGPENGGHRLKGYMHNRRNPVDVLLGYSTLAGIRTNNFLAIRVHNKDSIDAEIVVFKPGEKDYDQWYLSSGPYLTLEEIKPLFEKGTVKVKNGQWSLIN